MQKDRQEVQGTSWNPTENLRRKKCCGFNSRCRSKTRADDSIGKEDGGTTAHTQFGKVRQHLKECVAVNLNVARSVGAVEQSADKKLRKPRVVSPFGAKSRNAKKKEKQLACSDGDDELLRGAMLPSGEGAEGALGAHATRTECWCV